MQISSILQRLVIEISPSHFDTGRVIRIGASDLKLSLCGACQVQR